MSELLTVDMFRSVLPAQVKKSVNQELVDSVNNLLSDPESLEKYRDNLLSYTNVMANGRFKIKNYLSAVKYISHKLDGDSNTLAYTKTFPDKMQGFITQGVVPKDIASYISAYNKSKLVMLIFEQTLVPTHVLNNAVFQKAINVQAELMVTASSEKVRSDAANSLLTHLKPPETKKIELDLAVTKDTSIDDMRAATLALVTAQRVAVEQGVHSVKDIAHSQIISEAEFEEV